MIYKNSNIQLHTNEAAADIAISAGILGGSALLGLIMHWKQKHKPFGFTILKDNVPEEFNNDALLVINGLEKNLHGLISRNFPDMHKNIGDTRIFKKNIEKCKNKIEKNTGSNLSFSINVSTFEDTSVIQNIVSKTLSNIGFGTTPPYTKDESFFKSLKTLNNHKQYLYKKYSDNIYCIVEAAVAEVSLSADVNPSSYMSTNVEVARLRTIQITMLCIDINEGKNKTKMHMETFNFINNIEFI